METMHKITAESEAMYRDFGKAITDAGLEGGDCYYTSDGYHLGYFKIPKEYKKENEGDADFHHIFVDVEERDNGLGMGIEYTVHGSFAHEHMSSIEKAIDLCQKLYSGEVVEIGFSSGSLFATTFTYWAGGYEESFKVLVDRFDEVRSLLENPLVQGGTGHLHIIFQPEFGFSLLGKKTDEFRFQGVNAYFFTGILAEHPEYYVVG